MDHPVGAQSYYPRFHRHYAFIIAKTGKKVNGLHGPTVRYIGHIPIFLSLLIILIYHCRNESCNIRTCSDIFHRSSFTIDLICSGKVTVMLCFFFRLDL